MTKVTASRGHSNAAGLRLYHDAKSSPSEFGMEIARPLRAPFAKGDEPCIMGGRTPANHTIQGLMWVDSPSPRPLPCLRPARRDFAQAGARGEGDYQVIF
jgi:hypothetical protein